MDHPFDTLTPLQRSLLTIRTATPREVAMYDEATLRGLPGMTDAGIQHIKSVLAQDGLTLSSSADHSLHVVHE